MQNEGYAIFWKGNSQKKSTRQKYKTSKLGKSEGKTDSYRRIALHKVCYKLLEWFIVNGIEPIIGDIILFEEAERSYVDQVLTLPSQGSGQAFTLFNLYVGTRSFRNIRGNIFMQAIWPQPFKP